MASVRAAARKIGFHHHGQQQTLRLRPLGIRHADTVKNLKINNGNFRHAIFCGFSRVWRQLRALRAARRPLPVAAFFEHRVNQDFGRLIEWQLFGVRQFEPAEFPAFVVQFHHRVFMPGNGRCNSTAQNARPDKIPSNECNPAPARIGCR